MLGQILKLLGLKLQDAALLFGALAFLAGLVALGVSGNLYRRRWLTRLGWLIAIVGLAAAIFGMVYTATPAAA